MKKLLFIIFINIVSFAFINGQSKTFELIIDFDERGSEFISKEYQLFSPEESLEFIGLSCYHFDRVDTDIYYKLKIDNKWSDWTLFIEQHEYVAPDRLAYSTAPIQKSFSDIQFKTSDKLATDLTVRFFLANDEKSTFETTIRSVSCELPDVCERSCWCPTCPMDNTPVFTEPTHLIVHHSAGNNESNNFETVVEYIWDLHVNTNGWDDIGYNWLIDPNGSLYEGRSDNWQGAHFSCINENTVGICILGNYTSVQPSESALTTLVSLLAYEATEHAIDVNGQSYHVTGDFILENLAGHRDSGGSYYACSTTVCPGDAFYPMLEDIRAQVSVLPCYDVVSSSSHEKSIENMKVFPNPIHQKLHVVSDQKGNQILKIFDLYGRSVGFVNSETVNDVSHLKAGVYFLVYKNQLIEKIIKI